MVDIGRSADEITWCLFNYIEITDWTFKSSLFFQFCLSLTTVFGKGNNRFTINKFLQQFMTACNPFSLEMSWVKRLRIDGLVWQGINIPKTGYVLFCFCTQFRWLKNKQVRLYLSLNNKKPLSLSLQGEDDGMRLLLSNSTIDANLIINITWSCNN